MIDLITNSVATKSWGENGGNGTISSHGNLLCICQTFRSRAKSRPFWPNFGPSGRPRRPWSSNSNGSGWTAGNTSNSWAAQAFRDGRTRLAVDAKALDLLGRKAPGFRGRIVCGNGQLVHLASGDRRSTIVNAIPVVGGGIGYSPVVQAPNAGVVVELRPTVAPGGTTAIIDVQSFVTRWGRPQATAQVGEAWPANQVVEGTVAPKKEALDPAGSASCPVQQPTMPAQQLATTARVPLGKPVVLGGMTFATADSAGMDKATDNPAQLYLIATTTIGE